MKLEETFLQQSILLSPDGQKLDLREVPQDGIWVSRTAVRHSQRLYRLSITTTTGKHYDLRPNDDVKNLDPNNINIIVRPSL